MRVNHGNQVGLSAGKCDVTSLDPPLLVTGSGHIRVADDAAVAASMVVLQAARAGMGTPWLARVMLAASPPSGRSVSVHHSDDGPSRRRLAASLAQDVDDEENDERHGYPHPAQAA